MGAVNAVWRKGKRASALVCGLALAVGFSAWGAGAATRGTATPPSQTPTQPSQTPTQPSEASVPPPDTAQLPTPAVDAQIRARFAAFRASRVARDTFPAADRIQRVGMFGANPALSRFAARGGG